MVKFHPKKIHWCREKEYNHPWISWNYKGYPYKYGRGIKPGLHGMVVLCGDPGNNPNEAMFFFLSFWLFFFLFFLSYAKDWKTVASLVPIFWTFLPPVSEPQVTHKFPHNREC
jgi:hypothetical protein